MDTEKAISARHSVRYFTDQIVSEQDLRELVTAAQQAPSWVNSQPEHIYIATGATLETVRQAQAKLDNAGPNDRLEPSHSDLPVTAREKWSQEAQANMAQWSAGITTALGQNGSHLMQQAAAKLYNAPAVVYLTLPSGYSSWSLYDLGAFGQTLILAAQNRHIDSMTAYQFVKYPNMLRQNLAIPENEQIISGIALGYADKDAAVNRITAQREALDQVLKISN